MQIDEDRQDVLKSVIPLRDPMVHDLHTRVIRLEQSDSAKNTELAVLRTDMGYVKTSVDGIQKGINRILWAIGLSVVAAATTFVLSGGLTVSQ
jgi:hypothetical protein